MKRYIHFTLIITILFVMFQTTVYAQTPNNLPYNFNFDSLVKVNENYHKQDVRKLKLLNNLAFGYTRKNLLKGIKTAEQAIALAQKLNNKILLAEAMNNKGLYHTINIEYTTAMELYDKAVAINQELKNTYGNAYNNLNIGNLLIRTRDTKKAKEHFEQALKLFESLANREGIAASYTGLGNLNLILYNYPRALECFQKALDINELIGNIIGKAEAIGNIGKVYTSLSEYTKSLEYFKKSLAISEQTGDLKIISFNLTNIGAVYGRLSDYSMCLQYYKKALKINEQFGNINSIAIVLGNLGNTHLKLSDYSIAIEFLLKSLAISEKSGNNNELASLYNRLGVVYTYLNNYPKALEFYQKSLEINEKLNNMEGIATALDNIGGIYLQTKEYYKSLEMHRKALEINEQIEDKDGIAHSISNIGEILVELSNYREALQAVQKAVEIFEQIGNKNELAFNLDDLGLIYANAPDSALKAMNILPDTRYQKALEYQIRGLRLYEEIGNVEGQKDSWKGLSITYEKQGDFAKAYEAYKKAIVLTDSIKSEEITQKVDRKMMQYEFEKKEIEFKFQQQLTEEKLLRRTQEALLSQQQLRLSNKEKDLVHLAYLKEKAEKQQNENRLALSEKEKQLQLASIRSLGKEKDLQQSALQLSQAELKRKNLQRNGFIVGMLLFLALSFFIYRNFVSQRRSNQLISEALLNLKNTQAQLILAENQKNSALEKARIARDMHDDIGSGLTRIAFMTEFLKSGSNVNKKQIDEIANTANELVDNMSQIIWAMNPENDKLENLFGYLRKYSLDFFENSLIKCNVSIEGDLGSVVLTQSIKRNLFLVIKELLNNVLKHSKATKVSIKALQDGDILKISISDNGVGFDPETASKSGNGLNNMQKRMQEINSNMEVISSPGNGTTTVLYCNCTKNKNV